MPLTIDLDGHRALVTGAGQGVGQGIAEALATAGAHVVVNDLDPQRAAAVVEQLRAQGGSAEAAPFDVTDFDAVVAALADLDHAPDILVNNAGNAGASTFAIAPFADTVPADWDRYLAVNLNGVLHCTRAVLPAMIAAGGGRIVTIISEAARSGEPGLAVYAAAKAGAAGFVRSLAKEVGRHGIAANIVALGSIDNPARHADAEQEARFQRQVRRYVLGRLGTPDDVAGIVAFLVSPLASWITGQTIPLNGGYTINQ
jgi:NAD(P)-dependent dehydrogenase (short-subunit alcohol dehydrogenase family)